MANTLNVIISKELLDAIFESARRLYPKETIMLLRGKKKKDVIQITDLLVPPLATYGYGFANLPLHMLPMDFSIMGMVHSHPSGNLTASDVDFNHFFGRIIDPTSTKHHDHHTKKVCSSVRAVAAGTHSINSK